MTTPILAFSVLAAMILGAVFAAWRFRVSDDSSGGAVGVVIAPCALALYLAAAAMGVVIGWEDFKGAEEGVATEAGAAQALYWSAASLPAEEAETVRGQLRTYLTTVVEEDWPLMQREGELSPEGDEALADLAASVRVLSSTDAAGGLDLLTARQELTNLSDARIERADAAGDGIPPVLTAITAVSAVAVAVLPFAMMKQRSATAYFWAAVNLLFVFAPVLLMLYMGSPYTGILVNDAGGIEDALAGFERADMALDAP
ncbi:bestrophin-like domain [Nocardiopsis potens]|uniref:bestrophin-like domain n=1 Tax=Nocardiopsis potens TaxID=1246458 RepID=UPI0003461CB8|nr:DUF4239 domain-containing protein [Nocardiopsis potens]